MPRLARPATVPIEDLTMDETDGFVDTTGIVTSIKSKNVVEFYVENPFVKIKDE